MEFTQLVKKGSASLFLVLLAHGLILGFSIPTTVLSVVLVSVVCLFEAQFVKSERVESEKRLASQTAESEKRIALMTTQFEQQVIKLSEQSQLEKEQLKEHLDNLKSQINGMKMNNLIRK
jgi:hypothetical protein